ncbi:M48 family metallopeptidase [uncultured Litoreibacter sp.]|uniref:M48 family metallopeptidase n=1 Tax=uncultured Litoreibacter sp. TaxID=1392394 RepID=UPI0026255D44|nr:M48 family metallopeptidase [uncultured Litoreibacter sp.]
MAATDPYQRFGLSVEGRAFASNSSAQIAARLLTRAPVQGEGSGPDDVVVDIVDNTGTVITSAPLSQIRVDPPIGTAARKLHFPDRALYETDDRAGIAALTGKTYGEKLNEYEAVRPRLIGFVAAAIVGCIIIWKYGLDLLVAGAIALTPPVLVEQLDKGTLQTIDFAMRAEPTTLDDAEQERIRAIFTNLLAELPADDVNDANFNLLFRNMEKVGPNAFALPGGTVIMTDQFAQRFGQDDVLAGVLGHEIGHVVEKHGLTQTYRSLGLYFIIGFLAGDTGPFIEDILLEGNLLLSLSFSRKHEAEADKFGVSLTRDAGYNPAGLKLFFLEMSKKGVEPVEWLSTHPNSGERVKQIDGYVDALD